MPQKIYLIRHGETDYNKERRLQGWLDIPLNDQGHAQAKITASKLVGISIDHIYSSDLRRAYETAQYVKRIVKKEIIKTPALRERDMGIFSGWAWESEQDEIKSRLWAEFGAIGEGKDMDWNKHQGESMNQMSLRVSSFMTSIHHSHPSQSIMIVTHSGTINRILEHYRLKSLGEGFRSTQNAQVLVLHKESTSYRLEEL